MKVIDLGQYEPESEGSQNAEKCYQAAEMLIAAGYTYVPDIAMFKIMAYQAVADPMGDSGMSREDLGLHGNFTNEGVFYFSLIYTGSLPGMLSEITGLPGSWQLEGFTAGEYDFASNPRKDTYSLTFTDINTVYESLEKVNSGVYSMAYERDIYKFLSGNYPINWANIKVPVYWINTEGGFDDSAGYPISLLVNSPEVVNEVVDEYDHMDSVSSKTAETDFWPKLFPLW